jgi:hypothetical protein
VDGDAATGTWHQQEVLHQKDSLKPTIAGKYLDNHIKSGGRRLFAKQTYDVLEAH